MTETKIVQSTADLTPDGILGYAKSIAVFVGGLLGILAQFITDDPLRTYVSIGIAVCTFVGAYGFKNAVKPVSATPVTPAAVALDELRRAGEPAPVVLIEDNSRLGVPPNDIED